MRCPRIVSSRPRLSWAVKISEHYGGQGSEIKGRSTVQHKTRICTCCKEAQKYLPATQFALKGPPSESIISTKICRCRLVQRRGEGRRAGGEWGGGTVHLKTGQAPPSSTDPALRQPSARADTCHARSRYSPLYSLRSAPLSPPLPRLGAQPVPSPPAPKSHSMSSHRKRGSGSAWGGGGEGVPEMQASDVSIRSGAAGCRAGCLL